MERFTYVGSDIHVSACCEPEVNRRVDRAWGVMESLVHGGWSCQYLCGRMKVRVFRSLVIPVLLYGCETWTLTRDLRRRLNSFGTRSLPRILVYCWSDLVSNEQLMRETQMRFVTCIVRECQLWLYGHVARFPDADPAHQILLAREPREWRRATGWPLDSWLQQVDEHLKEMGMGQASAWGMVRWRPLDTRGKWTLQHTALVHAPIPDLSCSPQCKRDRRKKQSTTSDARHNKSHPFKA